MLNYKMYGVPTANSNPPFIPSVMPMTRREVVERLLESVLVFPRLCAQWRLQTAIKRSLPSSIQVQQFATDEYKLGKADDIQVIT